MTTRTLMSGDAADSNLSRGDAGTNSFWSEIAHGMSTAEREELEEILACYEGPIEKYAHLIACEVIKRAFTLIMQRQNYIVAAFAFLKAWGFTTITDESLEKIGEQLGVTKQDVSKEIVFFRDCYRLKSFGTSKTEEAREAYREVQTIKNKEPKQDEPTNGIGFDDFYRSRH